MSRPVYIPLGGRERQIRFDIPALERLEADGYPVQNLIAGTKQVTFTVQLIWRGLQHKEPDLTRENVVGLLQIAADNGTPLTWYLEQAVAALQQSGIFVKVEEAVPGRPTGSGADDAERTLEPAASTP
jgi:hypothetical protein